MSLLSLRLLGPFTLELEGGVPVPVKAKKAQALIGYLATRPGRPIPRAFLAELLWPDSDPEVARANLRQMLTVIRSIGPEIAAAIQTPDRDHLLFDPSACAVDVLEFERADSGCAVDIYRGPFLEGQTGDWIEVKRVELSEAYLAGLESLAKSAGAKERIPILRAAVELEPFREPLVRGLMTALIETGDHSGARYVYRRFEELLRKELGSEPSMETKRLLREEPRKVGKPSNNLPAPLTSFVGRDLEMAEVADLLVRNRLVTLVGSGGCGKTRLSLRVVSELLDRFRDGIWLIELAPVADPDKVADVLLSAVGLNGPSPIEELRDKEILLLLDNCEHLLETCASLAIGLLQACKAVKILATSREALGIPGEQVYRVPSLNQAEASRLFVDRATLHLANFAVTDENTPTVASICRRLDGIPLAIELAAAHVRSLSVPEIEARLNRRFSLLTRGSKSLLPRQQTLRALIDWSYNLLDAQEKLLLCRLSVFAGTWSLAAAESVCLGTGIEGDQVEGLLTALVEKSLVSANTFGVGTQFGMLETVRQYAVERLGDFEDGVDLVRRHRQFFLDMAEDAAPRLSGYREMSLFSVLEQANDNFRLAIANCISDEKGREYGLRFVASLWLFWFIKGHVTEGRQAFEALRREEHVSEKVLADASFGAGWLALRQADYEAARELFKSCLETRISLEDAQGIANSLHGLGQVALQMGEYNVAEPALIRSLSIRRELGDKWGIAACLDCLGHIAFWQGDYSKAKGLYQEALEIKRETSNRQSICMSLIGLALIAIEVGELAVAGIQLVESLDIQTELGVDWLIVNSLEAYAKLAFKQGNFVKAVRLWGAASVQRGEVGYAVPVNQRAKFLADMDLLRGELGAVEFEVDWEAGRLMSTEQAIAFASIEI